MKIDECSNCTEYMNLAVKLKVDLIKAINVLKYYAEKHGKNSRAAVLLKEMGLIQ